MFYFSVDDFFVSNLNVTKLLNWVQLSIYELCMKIRYKLNKTSGKTDSGSSRATIM